MVCRICTASRLFIETSNLASQNECKNATNFLSVLLGRCYDDVKLSDFGAARSLKNITRTLTKGFDEFIK